MADATPPCRLFLTLPARPSATVERSMAEVLDMTDVACILLRQNGAGVDAALDLRLRELTRARDVALLTESDAGRAQRTGADGIHIPPDAALYRQTRVHLGQRAIIGVGCNGSRHEAMVLAELGADYVAFGPGPALGERGRQERAELIAWWSEIFVVPCVAWDVETLEEAANLAGLGADFVAPSPSFWETGRTAERIARIGAALRETRTS
jgi:thiamine-phosphate pyrophosphorylase